MKTRITLSVMVAAAGMSLGAAAQSGMPSYEPSQRMRTALDTCLKTEVMNGAYCVRKCGAGFRMELSGTRARCIGLTPDAKYQPPEPSFKPPAEGTPRAPRVPGA